MKGKKKPMIAALLLPLPVDEHVYHVCRYRASPRLFLEQTSRENSNVDNDNDNNKNSTSQPLVKDFLLFMYSKASCELNSSNLIRISLAFILQELIWTWTDATFGRFSWRCTEQCVSCFFYILTGGNCVSCFIDIFTGGNSVSCFIDIFTAGSSGVVWNWIATWTLTSLSPPNRRALGQIA